MTELPRIVEGRGRLQLREEMLRETGAVLFRGFDVRSAEELEEAAAALSPRLDDYQRGISPRKKISGRVYSSTEVDARYPIPMHCEMAYARDPPRRVIFWCELPARTGGETPIADARKVYRRVPGALRERLEREGVLLAWRLAAEDGLRAGWRSAFATGEKAEVERICAASGIVPQWMRGGALRLSIRGPAVIHHPLTGEPVWFNNLLINHDYHSRLLWERGMVARSAALRLLEAVRPPRLRPFDCFFGASGERIRASAIAAIRAAFAAETVRFAWRAGDVLLLDNFAVAHGREPYRGPRKVRVVLVDRAPLAAA